MSATATPAATAAAANMSFFIFYSLSGLSAFIFRAFTDTPTSSAYILLTLFKSKYTKMGDNAQGDI